MRKLLLQKHIYLSIDMVSLKNLGSEALKLKSEALKTRKRSTQNSEMKHQKLETCLSFKNTRQSLVKSPMLTRQESSTTANRMQFKTIQVELRGVANTFLSP